MPGTPPKVCKGKERMAAKAVANIKKVVGECTKICEESTHICINLAEDPELKVV
jgi:hypothetical protein